jgi:hypothetical protein
MDNAPYNEPLLADVLGEGVSADFRAGLLGQTLRLACRRRRIRQIRSAAAALAVLTAFGFLVWHHLPRPPARRSFPARPYTWVDTQPLPPASWVGTRPLPVVSLLASGSTRTTIVASASAKERAREINDDELLALAPGPAALVRRGPHSAELVFVSQAAHHDPL